MNVSPTIAVRVPSRYFYGQLIRMAVISIALAAMLLSGEAKKAQQPAGTLAGRELVRLLSEIRLTKGLSGLSDADADRAIMACVGLCMAGHIEQWGSSGPWRQIALRIAAERQAKRTGKGLILGMPDLWCLLLNGKYHEALADIDRIPEKDRDLPWRILRSYALADPTGLKASDGPWATVALLRCDRLEAMSVNDPRIDPYIWQCAANSRTEVWPGMRILNSWVVDVAAMLTSKELGDKEALPILHRLAQTVGVAKPESMRSRDELVKRIENSVMGMQEPDAAVIGACLDALDRGSSGHRVLDGTSSTMAGLGDVALWLGDRFVMVMRIGSSSGEQFNKPADHPLVRELLAAHKDWPPVARLAFGQDGQPRVPGARDIMYAALERALSEPRRMSPALLQVYTERLKGDARMADMTKRIDGLVDPDHPSYVANVVEGLIETGQHHLLRPRVMRAYANGSRDLVTLWYAGVWNPKPQFVLNTPVRTWVETSLNGQDAPWKGQQDTRTAIVIRDGWLKIDAPGNVRFSMSPGTKARVLVHGEIILDGLDGSPAQRHDGAIELGTGAASLRIEQQGTIDTPCCTLLWSQPGVRDMQAIPASALSHGLHHVSGLKVEGHLLDRDQLRVAMMFPISAYVAAAVRERPFDIALNAELFYRALGSDLDMDPLSQLAAMQIAQAMTTAGDLMPFPGLTQSAADAALTGLLGQQKPDVELVRVLLRNMGSLRFQPRGSQMHTKERLEPPYRVDPQHQSAVRRHLLIMLSRKGLAADPGVRQAVNRVELSGMEDHQLRAMLALYVGDLQGAYKSLAPVLEIRGETSFGASYDAHDLLVWMALDRQYGQGGKDSATRVKAALDRVTRDPAHLLAWNWLAGNITWSEASKQANGMKGGHVLLWIRGIYDLTIGRRDSAVEQFSAYIDQSNSDIMVYVATNLRNNKDQIQSGPRKADRLPQDEDGAAEKPKADF
jgi:hypothetical protein